MDFIAVLNYEHLDNGMFLTAFAKSLSQKKKRGIILHGDSEYTERIIQTGVMREDAVKRSMKDLNHRLVALFADQGISTIGINGYQKSMISIENGALIIDKDQLEKLPEHPMILISSLVDNQDKGTIEPAFLSELSFALQLQFELDYVTTFSIKDSVSIIKEDLPKLVNPSLIDKKMLTDHIPEAFHSENREILLSTPDIFGKTGD